MPKVSVIIPVYNAEAYIDRCLSSLINQTLKDIEIICINDGSVDNSEKILEKYSQKDFRIKIINQTNQKQGAARNKGLDIAQGEFIAFVDIDDWVDEDYLELLYNAAQKYNVNIAVSTATRDYKNKIKYHYKPESEDTYFGANDIIKALKNNLITHSKIYRFECIKNLRYEEQVLYEDGLYTLQAIDTCNSMVTVPKAHYHYFSNPTSTVKQRRKIRNEIDKISTNLQIINYAKEHNINMGNWLVLKEDHILWKIKHYFDYREIYLFGIKIFKQKKSYNNEKTFVVYNTACFGDVLLCNSLCQNIKKAFPNSKIVFVATPAFADVAKYQACVDDVVVFDKKGKHKGTLGILKFIKDFKYKNIFASFVTYRSLKNWLIAKLSGSKIIKMGVNEKIPKTPTQVKHNLLLKEITNKNIINYPIRFNLPENIQNKAKEIIPNEDYIVLCTTSKRKEKDMPIITAAELINKITKEMNCKTVFVGVGDGAIDYSSKLKESACEFVDLTNKTSLLELGKVIKDAKALISIDTGTLHYGLSLQTPVCAIFYEPQLVTNWAPDETIYKAKVVKSDYTAQDIFDKTQELIQNNKETENV